MFEAFGMDLATEGTQNTRTGSSALFEATSGYEGDEAPDRVPDRMSRRPRLPDQPGDRGPIPFFSLCEHHAFPLYGVAHVGYVAHERSSGSRR